MNREAIISSCGRYRYHLSRSWGDLLDQGKPGYVAFCMLNPSTADATIDDPTIRRCIAFANAWGWKALIIVNLFALRATDPKVMRKDPSPVGPDNHLYLESAASHAEMFICAWGNDGTHMNRSECVTRFLKDKGCKLWSLGELTDKRQPRHPLYLKGDLVPKPLA